MFSSAFQRYADQPCIRDGDRVASYEEVLTTGRARISGLPRQRSLVVLRCALDLDTISAYAALLVDGHVPLLVESSLARPLLDRIVQIYRPDAIIGDGITLCDLDDSERTRLHPDLALLLSTSGSTGSPKLVRLAHRGLLSNAEAIIDYLGITSKERPLLNLPISYSYGMSIVNSHLLAGAAIGLSRSSVMQPSFWTELTDHGATSISGVPFFYQTLRRFGPDRLEIASLRTLTQAGGRLDPKLVRYFAGWAAQTKRRFVVMYGQTEAGPRISYLPDETAASAPDAIGVPIKDVKISLLDERGLPVAEGEAGEMHVQSPGVMLGYAHQASDLSLDDQMGGALATGDLATRNADGLLRIVGRQTRMIKVYGLRVNLEDVERQLQRLGLRAYCFGADDRLQVMLEAEVGQPGTSQLSMARATIVQTFSIPASGVEVRLTTIPPERSETGKVTALALSDAWAVASRR